MKELGIFGLGVLSLLFLWAGFPLGSLIIAIIVFAPPISHFF